MGSNCSHLQFFQHPSDNSIIFKKECTLCFQSVYDPDGIFICLTCFESVCGPQSLLNHSYLHYTKTAHQFCLNLKLKEPVDTNKDAEPQPPNIISADISCLACAGTTVTIPAEDPLWVTKELVLSSINQTFCSQLPSSKNSSIACPHLKLLSTTPADTRPIHLKCMDCDLTENLWICLSCGFIGCSRSQFGANQGNSHSFRHSTQKNHALVCKIGTMKKRANADVYCNSCDDPVNDLILETHMKSIGIDIDQDVSDEKNTTELEKEANETLDLANIYENDNLLERVFGEALNGFINMGNSCYISSALSCIFHIPEIALILTKSHHSTSCPLLPSECIICQLLRLQRGVTADPSFTLKTVTPMRPDNFKFLFGREFPTFSDGQQHDVLEFFQFLVQFFEILNLQGIFSFPLHTFFEHQSVLQRVCVKCHQTEVQEEKKQFLTVYPKETDQEVPFSELIETMFDPEFIQFKCTTCGSTSHIITNFMKTFPLYLVVQICGPFKAQSLEKIEVPMSFPSLEIDLTNNQYKSDVPPISKNLDLISLLKEFGFSSQLSQLAILETGSTSPDHITDYIESCIGKNDPDVPELSKPCLAQLLSDGYDDIVARKALGRAGNNYRLARHWLKIQNIKEESPQQVQYELQSFIMHKGKTINSGHYVSFSRVNGNWYRFNDEKVYADPNPPLGSGYLYFFSLKQ